VENKSSKACASGIGGNNPLDKIAQLIQQEVGIDVNQISKVVEADPQIGHQKTKTYTNQDVI
jgi:hypothetical protein